MRALERRLNALWYGKGSASLLLAPLSTIFSIVTTFRRSFYERGWLRAYRASVPVVVIGNLSVGGTGKSPLVAHVAATLARRGLRPGILLRGYGAAVRGPRRVSADTPVDETLRALDDLVTQGKVRYLGNSNYSGWQIADADWIAAGQTRFVSAQNLYSLLERDVEREVLPACEHFGLGFLPFFPLASGLLTGKYKRGVAPPEGTRLAAWGARGEAAMSDANFDKVEALEAWAAERGHTLLELAFAWLLGHEVVSSVIAGATSVEQVRTNAATAGWRLTPEEVAEVSKL